MSFLDLKLSSSQEKTSFLNFHAMLFQSQASYLEGLSNIALPTSHVIGKGDKDGGR